jgi:hypothetical protein
MSRFLLNLRLKVYLFQHYRKRIPMSLTPAQLQTIQDDLDALKVAVSDDTTAQANIDAATEELTNWDAILTHDEAVKAGTVVAIDTAEKKLLADVESLVAPTP